MASDVFPSEFARNFASSEVLFASSGVNVDFDSTFIVQMVVFTAFVLILKPLVFDPILRVFEEREKRTDGAKQAAREMDEEAGDLLQRYEAAMDNVRREASVERERLRAETAKLEAKIMAEARDESTKIIEEGKAKVDTEVASLRRELEAARPALAREIAGKMLGRELGS